MNKQRRTKINEALVLIDRAREILEEVRDEEQESFDNLPEGLQEGERGELVNPKYFRGFSSRQGSVFDFRIHFQCL